MTSGNAKINDKWAKYLDERKHEFAAVSFLSRGYRRFGKVTSNGVETINGVLLDAREMPIVDMIDEIVEHHQKQLFNRCERATALENEQRALTPYAMHSDIRIGDLASH